MSPHIRAWSPTGGPLLQLSHLATSHRPADFGESAVSLRVLLGLMPSGSDRYPTPPTLGSGPARTYRRPIIARFCSRNSRSDTCSFERISADSGGRASLKT